MKSLEDIKHEVAKKNCFCDWKELLTMCTADMIEEHWTEAATTYANQFTERGILIVAGQRRGRNEMLKVIAAHPDLPLIIANVNHNPEAIKMHSVEDLKEIVGDWPKRIPVEPLSFNHETMIRIAEGRSKFFGPKPKDNYRKK